VGARETNAKQREKKEKEKGIRYLQNMFLLFSFVG